jgi:DNA-binding response OmpR family regulator
VPEESVHQKGYIVIVETDDLIRELLERWLGEAGYAVFAGAPTTPAPQERARLVIVNVSKPRNAGALIRTLESAYAAPVLAVSARFRRGLGASADAARRLGACKVLPKPFTRAELLAAVRESIEDP